jgi:hypothetical protein
MLESSEPPSGTAPPDRDALAWRMAKLRRYDLNLLLSLHAVADIERALTWRPAFDPCVETRSFSIAMSDHVLALLLPRWARGCRSRPRT